MTPDLSALSTSFLKFGGQIFMKGVNDFDFKGQGIQVFKNVKAPMPLTKLSATGNIRPYREQDDAGSNGVVYSDRLLTVYNSKWDMDVDPEKYRNTYLADGTDNPFYKYVLEQVAKEYMSQINDNVAYLGVYNASGSTAAAVATGWGTLIADLITATTITPVVTGAITTANAVTKVELVAKDSAVKPWMRKKGLIVYCSYATFDKYTAHYRTLNGFQYKANNNNEYVLDGINAKLMPVSWMGTSSRLICTVANNLCAGTDGESVKIASSVRRNIIELRPMMPIGFQIADLDCLVVNDQA